MTNTGREIHPDVNSKNQPKTIKKSEIVILMFEYKRLNYPSQIPFWPSAALGQVKIVSN
jgi:hypothetical protein